MSRYDHKIETSLEGIDGRKKRQEKCCMAGDVTTFEPANVKQRSLENRVVTREYCCNNRFYL